MSEIKKAGTFTAVDDEGNTIKLYPNPATDDTLSTSGKAADAKLVGDKLAKVLYIDSFDASTGVLTTRSQNYNG